MESKDNFCPVCLVNQVTCVMPVDWRSDTEIDCCDDCADMLAEYMSHCYYATGRSFFKQNKDKLKRAHEALNEEYRKAAEKR